MAVAVAVVGYDDAELLDIACVTTTLATATSFLAGQYSSHAESSSDGTGRALRVPARAGGRR